MKPEKTGTSLATILGIVFIILKLTGYITWSWWWVLAPFWVPMGFVLAVLLIVGIFGVVAAALSKNNW